MRKISRRADRGPCLKRLSNDLLSIFISIGNVIIYNNYGLIFEAIFAKTVYFEFVLNRNIFERNSNLADF